jgi:hypothetical protein
MLADTKANELPPHMRRALGMLGLLLKVLDVVPAPQLTTYSRDSAVVSVCWVCVYKIGWR